MAQYGALLMSILAVTVRLVGNTRTLFPLSDHLQAGETYFQLSKRLLQISTNKLDIRYILALYRRLYLPFACSSWT